MDRRPIGTTGLLVTPVAMGCWPIAGITSIDVSEEWSRATIAAAFDAGINFFDTAYSYGYAGQSERMIGQFLGRHRDEIVVATKGGIAWASPGQQVKEGSPAALRRHCEESLRRLGTDHVDLYYLHAPDPEVPIAESAAAIRRLMEEGKTRSAGLSNASLAQLQEFAAACPLAAFQPHYNMLQREIESTHLAWCIAQGIAVIVYWPLMKGLLAGKLARDHVFDPRDGRAKYPMFQGDEWQRNQDFLEGLRRIADQAGKTVAQLVVNWTIHRPGITAALCGAKRPDQIIETAGAMGWKLTGEQLAQIDQALALRGTPVSRAAVS